MKGLVLKSTGSWYKVISKSGEIYQCRIRGKLKLQDLKTTNPIAVGDRVNFDLENDIDEKTQGIIFSIEDRTNYIIRKSVHKAGYGHILAANIDQLVLMITLKNPKTSLGFIDRLLVNSESFRIPAVLLFNKIDVMDEKDILYMKTLASRYQKLGYESYSISALKETGIPPVVDILTNRVTLLAGHSGVGKSTFVNTLSPEIAQQIRDISKFSKKGKHTTTFAEMFKLAEETYLIDSPGIKELGMIDMEDWEISHYFPEMRKHLGECKFKDCLHLDEPGCAITEALSKGEIEEPRYLSYLSMLENDDNRR